MAGLVEHLGIARASIYATGACGISPAEGLIAREKILEEILSAA